jgi:hypothetical protein
MKAALLGGDVGKAALGGAMVAEAVAETVGSSRDELKARIAAQKEIEGDSFDPKAFGEFLIHEQQGPASWGKFGAALAAFLTKQDVNVALETGTNAVENNLLFIPFLLAAGVGGLKVAGAVDTALDGWEAYEEDGLFGVGKFAAVGMAERLIPGYGDLKNLKSLGKLAKRAGIILNKPVKAKVNGKHFQQHHIISHTNDATKNHPLWQASGINPHSRVNIMLLPTKKGANVTSTKRALHTGRHTNQVSENLAEKMNTVMEIGKQKGWTQPQYADIMRKIMSEERQLLKTGARNLYKSKF